MKFFINIKDRLLNSLNNNLALVIYSLLVAILLWFLISITIYPTTPKTIKNVPLQIDITGTSAEENGLSVISYDTKNVNITIQGNRSRIGSISSDDLIAKAVVENVNNAGEKNLKITVSGKNSNIKFDVKDISPSSVNVSFDKIDTREFNVSVDAPNITAAKDLYMDEITCDPSVIEITGPSKQLDDIGNVVVMVKDKQVLDEAYIFHSSDVVLYDKHQSKIAASNLEISNTDFSIDVPVYMQKTLDLSYDLRYAPADFDASSIKLDLSTDKITLASPNAELAKLESWHIGSIPLYDIDMDFNESFTIEIPEYYKDLSNVSTVTAKLNTDGLATKEVSVYDISVINSPSDYDCKAKTSGLTFAIIGPEKDIEQITEKDILVYVDLLKYNIQSDSFTADATISFPKYKKVWAVGLQKVAINAEKKDQ